jgi:hypothetical protein
MKWIVVLLMACLICTDLFAQKTRTASKKRTATSAAKAMPAPVRLEQRGSYSAKSDPLEQVRRLQVSDSALRSLNGQAKPLSIISENGLLGVPKGTYGFANGRILLYSNSATSSGTLIGSGAVGTGTSHAGVGASGPATGLNGKNPYAAFGPYGNRVPVRMTLIDTLQKQEQ